MTIQEAIKSGKDFRTYPYGNMDWVYVGENGAVYWRRNNSVCFLTASEILGEWEIKP